MSDEQIIKNLIEVGTALGVYLTGSVVVSAVAFIIFPVNEDNREDGFVQALVGALWPITLIIIGIGLLMSPPIIVAHLFSKKDKCKHDWHRVEKSEIRNDDPFDNSWWRAEITVYKCERCGKVRNKEERFKLT